jgi:hypothetical protein
MDLGGLVGWKKFLALMLKSRVAKRFWNHSEKFSAKRWN